MECIEETDLVMIASQSRYKRPAAEFICAFKYNKLKVFHQTKSGLTLFLSSCDHHIGA
jgi:hypothetical protein